MKIVFVFNGFTETTGYTSNCLPKAMAKLGHEVHVIAPNVQVYFNHPNYKETFQDFYGDPIVETGTKELNGFQLHRLAHKTYKTEVYMKGLFKKLKSIRPEIVHVFQLDAIITHQLFWYKFRLGYKLFTANHMLKSVFPLADNWSNTNVFKKLIWQVKHFYPGRIINLFTKKTYCQTPDAKQIAIKFFGVRESICVIDPLGVDTDLFKPFNDRDKATIKASYGFTEEDFICIYTGRFTEGKNPLLLAKAIQRLQYSGHKIQGLFIGNGPQEKEILECDGCRTSPFVDFQNLPKVYNMAKIGIWPQQDSMSMLDALACGIPIIVSDKVSAIERVDGSGLMYEEGSEQDLADKIEELYKQKDLHLALSKVASEKIKLNYSWDKIAKNRELDYSNYVL